MSWRFLPFFAVFLLLVPAVQAEDGDEVKVLFDFGNGEIYWTTILIENDDAFNATVKAAQTLKFSLQVEYYGGTPLIASIHNCSNDYTGLWWHLWLWNESTEKWEMSSKGPSDVVCRNGMVLGWRYAVGWEGTAPTATPNHPYPWQSFRHDLHNSGKGDTDAGNDPLWSYNAGGMEIASSITVGQGMACFTVWNEPYKNGLFALNSTSGDLIWSAPYPSLSTPLIYDKYVFSGGTDGHMRCFILKNGTLLWNTTLSKYPGAVGITSSPVISKDHLIVGTFNQSGGGGNVYSLDIYTGKIIWAAEMPSSVYFSSPGVADNRVFIGLMGRYNASSFQYLPPYGLVCLNESNGNVLWLYTCDGSVASSPTIHNRTVLFTSKDGYLHCLDFEGRELWNATINVSTSSPSVSGAVYVGAGGFDGLGALYCVENAAILWNVSFEGGIQCSPAVGEKWIYVATNTAQGKIYRINKNGSIDWSYCLGDYILSSPTLSDRKLYIGCDNGYVYCFGDVAPTASFNWSLDGMKVHFMDNSSDAGGRIVSWHWDFGDGETSSLQNPTHEYKEEGVYEVSLMVVDDEGSISVYKTSIRVAPEGNRYLILVLVGAAIFLLIGGLGFWRLIRYAQ